MQRGGAGGPGSVRRGRAGRPDRAGRDGRGHDGTAGRDIQIKELVVTGTFRYANCYPAAIALAASGVVDLDGLVTARFGLEQVAEALGHEDRPAHPETDGLPGPGQSLTGTGPAL